MRLERSSIVVYKLPYPRPVRWKDSVEDGGLFMLLRLFSDTGLEGIAEGPIKPTWTGTTPRSLTAVIEDLLLPALRDVDLADPAAVFMHDPPVIRDGAIALEQEPGFAARIDWDRLAKFAV